MKNKKIAARFSVGTIFFLLLISSFSASASTYGTVEFDYIGDGVEAGGSVWRHTPYSEKVLSGELFKLNQIGGSYTPSLMGNDPSNVDKFSAFCLEPDVFISSGIKYEVSDLEDASKYSFASPGGIGATKASHIRQLMYQVYPVFGASLSNTTALAIQIALWEIVREQSDEYNVYRDYSDPDDVIWFSSYWSHTNHSQAAEAMSLAQTWLDDYVGKGGPELDNLYALVFNGKQDLLVQVNAVPIPAAVWLFGSAIAGLIGFSKRRKS